VFRIATFTTVLIHSPSLRTKALLQLEITVLVGCVTLGLGFFFAFLGQLC